MFEEDSIGDKTHNQDYEILFESDFEGLMLKGPDIDDIFIKYNDYAKDHGFKMRKSNRKSDKHSASFKAYEFCYFNCQFGHTKVFEKHGGYRKTQWKNELYQKGSAKTNPCKAKVIFEKDPIEEQWYLKEITAGHNHDPDPTLLSNEIVFYIDEFVTSVGCKIQAMDIVSHLRQRFQRDFDIPTLLHHLSQRFDIVHKAENVEFAKELVKEFPNEIIDAVFDEYELKRIIICSEEMQKRYQQYGGFVLMIDNLYSKFVEDYSLMLTGINQDGEHQVFAVIICQKSVDSLKLCFNKFLELNGRQIMPQTIIIDSDPYILGVCQEIFRQSNVQLSLYHILKRTKKIFEGSSHLSKAVELVTTDLFIKNYIDFTYGPIEPALTYDQSNLLLFLHDKKDLWQGLYQKKSVQHLGMNTNMRYKNHDSYKKIYKSLNQQKCSAKIFMQALEFYQGSQTNSINLNRDQFWFKNYQAFVSANVTTLLPTGFINMIQKSKIQHSKLAILYLFKEYYESLRWKIDLQTNIDINKPEAIKSLSSFKVIPMKQMQISKYSTNSLDDEIEKVKQRNLLCPTLQHKIVQQDEEEFETINLQNPQSLQNVLITCSCFYQNEYGGLPCRHKIKFMSEIGNRILGIDYMQLISHLNQIWLSGESKQMKPLSSLNGNDSKSFISNFNTSLTQLIQSSNNFRLNPETTTSTLNQ